MGGVQTFECPRRSPCPRTSLAAAAAIDLSSAGATGAYPVAGGTPAPDEARAPAPTLMASMASRRGDVYSALSPAALDSKPKQPGTAVELGGPGDPLRGLSVHFWNTTLLVMLSIPEDSDLNVYDVEPQIRSLSSEDICPRDGRRGAALVDVAPDLDAGLATVMLSYTWGYRVIDIARSLLAYRRARFLDPLAVRVWACCVCMNQHRVKERQHRGDNVPFEEFQAAFGERVRGIGNVVALLSPWCAPLYTRRAWCVYELYVATTTEGVTFEVILPPREAESFNEAFICEGLQSVWQVFARTKIKDACASVEADKTHILEMAERGPGHAALDRAVVERIRAWFVDVAVQSLEEMLVPGDAAIAHERGAQIASAFSQVVEFHCELGHCDAARELGKRGLAFCRDAGVECTVGRARLQLWYAIAFSKQGDRPGALGHACEALEVFEAAGAGCTPGAAGCRTFVGAVLRELGDYPGALRHLRGALEIFEASGAGGTVDAGVCCTAIGRVFQQSGDERGASGHLQKAMGIYEAAGSGDTPQMANCLRTLGRLSCGQGDHARALEHLHRAARLFEALGVGCTTPAAECHAWIGRAYQGQGDGARALEHSRRAVELYEHLGAAWNQDAKLARAAVELLGMDQE